METNGPQASLSCDLPLLEDQMVGVVFDEDAVPIPSHLPNNDAL